MPVYKRGSRYYIDIYVNGRRIRRSAGKKASKKDALAIERKLLDDALKFKQGITPEKTLSEAVLRWMDTVMPNLKDIPRTEAHIRALQPCIRGHLLKDAPAVAEEYKRLNRHLAPATVNRRLSILRAICNLAYDSWGWLENPIGRRIKMLPVNNARHVYLTPKQVDDIIGHCQRDAAKKMILLAVQTGLRRSELFQLSQDNVRDGCVILDSETKNGKPRVVPLPEAVLEIANELPLPITPQILRQDWEQAREKAGLKHVKFHDLRHTYASWLVQAGAPLRAVQDLLGHSSITMTQRYSHLGVADLRGVVGLLKKGE